MGGITKGKESVSAKEPFMAAVEVLEVAINGCACPAFGTGRAYRQFLPGSA